MRVELDRAGINNLDRQRPMYAQMLRAAKACKRRAFRIAPVESGHYKRSLFAAPISTYRAAAVYGATDFKAWWVEFGTKRGIPRKTHTLTRAALLEGLDVDRIVGGGPPVK